MSYQKNKTWMCLAAVFFVVCLCPALSIAEGEPAAADTETRIQFDFGYRGVDSDGRVNRAAEYVDTSEHDDGRTFGLDAFGSSKKKHIALEGKYLTQDDYLVNGHIDLAGQVRAEFRSEKMLHNLEHAQAFDLTDSGVWQDDQSPDDVYSVGIRIDETRAKVRLPLLPAHLSVGYWRLQRDGAKQMRFVDESCTNQCHVQFKTRPVDRITEELSGSVDAHVGPIDLIFEQLVRQFRDREAIPNDWFDAHGRPTPDRPAGDYYHDEDPNSKLILSTLKAHTSLSGGVNVAASTSLGKMENQSNLPDEAGGVSPVESETKIFKATGDVTYVPLPQLTFNFRYRLLDLDNENSDAFETPELEDIPDNIDTTRGVYGATVAYRPLNQITLKGNFQREDVERDFGPDTWDLPKEQTIDSYRVDLLTRSFGRKLKTDLWYQYQRSSEEVYGTTPEKKHQTFLGVSVNPAKRWGGLLNAQYDQESGDEYKIEYDADGNPATPADNVSYRLPHDTDRGKLTAGLWMNPHDRINLNLFYGYLWTQTTRKAQFGLQPAYAITADAESRQLVRNATATLGVQVAEPVRWTTTINYIRSSFDFDPEFEATTLPTGEVNDADLKAISRVEMAQRIASTSLDWQVSPACTCSGILTYADYDDVYANRFDGIVRTAMINLSMIW